MRDLETRYGVSFWKDGGKHHKYVKAQTLPDGSILYARKEKDPVDAIYSALANGQPLQCVCKACDPAYGEMRAQRNIPEPPCRAELFKKGGF